MLNVVPYLPFPENWPVFAPKDKLAELMESYAQLMELNVWWSTKLQRAKSDGRGWGTLERQFQNGGAEVRIFCPTTLYRLLECPVSPVSPKLKA